jgi:hypothetical protein
MDICIGDWRVSAAHQHHTNGDLHMRQRTCVITSLFLAAAAPALAQSGGGFDLSRSVIAGGGGTSSGGGFELTGTIGQHEAGNMGGGSFSLAGGFWGGASVPPGCYADCDANAMLNIDDFLCFINQFSQAQSLPPGQQVGHYANCNGNTTQPVLTIDDFLCFINEFSQGCP